MEPLIGHTEDLLDNRPNRRKPTESEHMMRIRIFADHQPGTLEEQINHWLRNEAGAVHVIKMETVVSPTEGIVITIWYEPNGGHV